MHRVIGRVAPPAWLALLSLLLIGALLGGVSLVRPVLWYGIPARALLATAGGALALLLASRLAGRVPGGGVLAGAAALLALVLGLTSTATWPNSFDEYGYLYLADTLLQGRLWNAPPPVPKILDALYIPVHEGRLFSQFAPGWPAFLVPFRALGLEQLAAPLLLGALGLMLFAALRRVTAAAEAARAVGAMVLLSPFLLFNGGSYFNHMLAACGVMAVCWLQLRDEAAPGLANRFGIGFAFSVVLVTRYEVFLLLAALYALDRLWHRRWRCLVDAVPVGLGALPVGLAFLAYNAAVTGHPFRTPLSVAAPFLRLGLWGYGYDGQHSPARALEFTGTWAVSLLEFAGVVLVLLLGLALLRRRRVLRFWDLLVPATVLFFTCYPDSGGIQYGPRYWLCAWPAAALSIAAALAQPGGGLRLFGTTVPAGGLLRAQLALHLGLLVPLAVQYRLVADARQAVFQPVPEQRPAVVLVPDRMVRLGPWQRNPELMVGGDSVRNGVDLAGPVLYAHARAGVPGEQIACGLAGHAVYRWQEPGRLEPVKCSPR